MKQKHQSTEEVVTTLEQILLEKMDALTDTIGEHGSTFTHVAAQAGELTTCAAALEQQKFYARMNRWTEQFDTQMSTLPQLARELSAIMPDPGSKSVLAFLGNQDCEQTEALLQQVVRVAQVAELDRKARQDRYQSEVGK